MKKAIKYFPWILITLHLIGIGLFVYFKKAPDLSYVNILLSAILVLLAEKNMRRAIYLFIFICFAGFLIELIGVQTGWLFGNYKYKAPMGPLFYGTPLMIGATWYAVVVGASNISWLVKGSITSRAFLAGFLAVLMDILIEKVAIHYGFWQWDYGVVPWYNYLCWFIFGTFFSFAYLRLTEQKNKVAIYLFLIWIGFFSILTLLR